MKTETLIWLALGAGVLWWLTRGASAFSDPRSPNIWAYLNPTTSPGYYPPPSANSVPGEVGYSSGQF